MQRRAEARGALTAWVTAGESGGLIPAVAAELGRRWGRLDGLLHAVGFAPASCLGGGFLDAPWEDVSTALHVSTYSYAALARGFADRVLHVVASIPYGETLSYGEVAAEAGNARAFRAAGSACGKNPVPLIVPPVPTPTTRWSILPSVCSQISGPVLS